MRRLAICFWLLLLEGCTTGTLDDLEDPMLAPDADTQPASLAVLDAQLEAGHIPDIARAGVEWETALALSEAAAGNGGAGQVWTEALEANDVHALANSDSSLEQQLWMRCYAAGILLLYEIDFFAYDVDQYCSPASAAGIDEVQTMMSQATTRSAIDCLNGHPDACWELLADAEAAYDAIPAFGCGSNIIRFSGKATYFACCRYAKTIDPAFVPQSCILR